MTSRPEGTSTRRLTKETGQFIRAAEGSKTLCRGLEVLRAFRLAPILTNAEISTRTGLPRSTVSRLTRSLVDAGFLLYKVETGAYRVAPIYLSLAKMFRSNMPLVDLAEPVMRRFSEKAGINVGLAVPDRQEMVYLEAIRNERSGMIRRATAGSRMPMETSATGMAYIASLPVSERRGLIATLIPAGSGDASRRRERLQAGISHLMQHGFSVGEWQPSNIGLSCPLVGPDSEIYVCTIGFMVTDRTRSKLIAAHSADALALAEEIRRAWQTDARGPVVGNGF